MAFQIVKVYFSTCIVITLIVSCHLAESLSENDVAKLDTLQLVQVIVRHGHRAPISAYPTDIYQNQSIYWPEGWSQLTKMGLYQHRQLGLYLRQRYEGFLPPKYFKRDFIAQSSDVDRAIQSAEANLAGLYELNKQITGKSLSAMEMQWQAVPIHTIPEESDIWINSNAYCPRHLQLMAQVYASPEIVELNKQNAEFLQFIEDKSGISGISSITDLGRVQDALKCEKFVNLTLPDWATAEVTEKLDDFKALTFDLKMKTTEMKRLKGGSMVGKLLDNFKAKAEAPEGLAPGESPFQDESPFRKMYFYSGHDSTIAEVMGIWQVFPMKTPPFAAALIMELHKEPGSAEPYIQFYYRNDSNKAPFALEIPGCGSPCLLSKLSIISSEFIPTDWDQECRYSLTAAAPDTVLVPVKATGLSTTGLLGFASVVALVGAVLGTILLASKYLKSGRSRLLGSPVGINSYDALV